MDQSPSSEPHSHWASQETTRLSWNPNVHYLIPNTTGSCPEPAAPITHPCIEVHFNIILSSAQKPKALCSHTFFGLVSAECSYRHFHL
jgi:hypothetical protein